MPELDVHRVFNGCSTIQLEVDRNTASTGKVHWFRPRRSDAAVKN